MIEAQRLAVFREVAHRGSFARAAQALRLTPSAVSQKMAALERAAQASLFERSTRGVTLTAAGQALLRTADAIHGELHRAERTLAQLREQGPPALTVATFASAGMLLLAPALAALADRRSPHVDTTVIESEPQQALSALDDGGTDMALVYHFQTEQPPPSWADIARRYEYHPLLQDELRLVVPNGHALARRSTARLDDVADEPWIQMWDLPGTALDALAAAHGLRPKVACRAGDFPFMQALVAAGVGIAFIPALAVEDRPDTRALVLTPTAKRYIGVYTAPGTPTHHASHALLDALKERAAAVRGQGASRRSAETE